jgi:hypothetical protein
VIVPTVDLGFREAALLVMEMPVKALHEVDIRALSI